MCHNIHIHELSNDAFEKRNKTNFNTFYCTNFLNLKEKNCRQETLRNNCFALFLNFISTLLTYVITRTFFMVLLSEVNKFVTTFK